MDDSLASNLKARRRQRGLTQQALATATGLSRVSIANYERGKTRPDSRSLVRLARALRVSTDSLLSDYRAASRFRFRSDASFRNDQAALADIAELGQTYADLERILGHAGYAPESVPCNTLERRQGLVSEVAVFVRQRLGLGEEPVTNVFGTFDRIGLKHLRQAVDKRGLFGVSAYNDEAGAFVLANTKDTTIERQIFTAAHELGHLIFHRSDFGNTEERPAEEAQQQEAVADYFAAHFLVPPVALRRELRALSSDVVFVSRIIRLKQLFRVSYMTMIRRFAEDHRLDQGDLIRTFRGTWKKRRGQSLAKHVEPEPLDVEDFPCNERFEQIVRQAYLTDQITASRAAELLGVSVMRLREQNTQRGNGH